MQLRLPLARFALVALVLTPTSVSAQQGGGEAPPAAPPPPPSAPSAPAPASSTPAAPPTIAQPAAPAPTEQGTPAVVLSQDESEGIIGKSVRSAAGEDMGRIVDIIVTATNQPRAAVIDFGGFLGVGSRKIAVDWRLLQYSRTGKTWGVTFALTRNQVRVSPEYKPGEPVVVLSMPAPAATGPAVLQSPPQSAGYGPPPAATAPVSAPAPVSPPIPVAPSPPAAPDGAAAAPRPQQ